jgi:hypothetical protein
MSIFDLEHIFIVFHPGAGGNFIASLLEKVVRKDVSSINIGTTGTAHTVNDRKIAGTDYLSFGTEVYEQSNFTSENDRINFYLDKIKDEYSDVTSPQIIWSHDFTNINLYKKYFPNSKILVIAQESYREKIAVVLFNVIKNILDVSTLNPLTPKRMTEVLSIWNFVVNLELVKLLGEVRAREVDKNSLLYKYVSFSKMMQYYMLDNTSNDVVNRVLYPAANMLAPGKLPYTIGKAYSDYTDGCIKLPFSYLMDNDSELLTETLSKLVHLNDEEKQIIVSNFAKYRNAQNLEILNTPIEYYATLKTEALTEI